MNIIFILYCNYFDFINSINIKYYLFSDYPNFKWKGCCSDKAKTFSSDILFMQESDSDEVLYNHVAMLGQFFLLLLTFQILFSLPSFLLYLYFFSYGLIFSPLSLLLIFIITSKFL